MDRYTLSTYTKRVSRQSGGMMTDFEQLLQKVENKKQEIANHQRILKKLLDKVDATCEHKELEEKEFYFSGSYNDTAYTDTWFECKHCKYKTEKKHQSHSWYG